MPLEGLPLDSLNWEQAPVSGRARFLRWVRGSRLGCYLRESKVSRVPLRPC